MFRREKLASWKHFYHKYTIINLNDPVHCGANHRGHYCPKLKAARLDLDLVYPRKWEIRVAVNPSNNHRNALAH